MENNQPPIDLKAAFMQSVTQFNERSGQQAALTGGMQAIQQAAVQTQDPLKAAFMQSVTQFNERSGQQR